MGLPSASSLVDHGQIVSTQSAMVTLAPQNSELLGARFICFHRSGPTQGSVGEEVFEMSKPAPEFAQVGEGCGKWRYRLARRQSSLEVELWRRRGNAQGHGLRRRS
jgi:hypothetical protein